MIFVYRPALSGPFEFDDGHSIRDNQAIHDLHNVIGVFTSAKYSTTMPVNWSYRPVTTFSNMLLWQVANGSPVPFRVFKLVVFILMGILLVRIWKILLPKVPEVILFAAISLFAVNPVNTEVLIYVSASSTLLAGFFSVLALWLYLLYRRELRVVWLALSLLSYFTATMAKEEGIAAYAFIVFIELYLRQTDGKRLLDLSLLKTAVLYLIPCGLDLLLFSQMYESTQLISRAQVTTLQYFITQWRAWLRYVVMYFVPYDLNSDNLNFGFNYSLKERVVLFSLLGNIILLAGSILLWRRRKPIFLFALMCFYAGVSPASSVVRLAEPVNDHRAFLGYMGFSVVSVWLLNWLWSYQKSVCKVVIAGVAVSYCAGTRIRAETYSNGEKFWRDVVAKNPSHARARNNLGVELMAQARYKEALEEIRVCIRLQDNYANCYINAAIVAAALGDDAEAEKNFNLGIQYDNFIVLSRSFYAQFLIARGDVTKALKLLEECDQFTHGLDLDVRVWMVTALVKMGDENRAAAVIRDSMKTFGRNPRIVPADFPD